MKINEKTQLGLLFETSSLRDDFVEGYRKFFDNNYSKLGESIVKKSNEIFVLIAANFISYESKKYAVSNTVIELVNKSKLPKNWDSILLSKIPMEKRSFLLGKNHFIKSFPDVRFPNVLMVGDFTLKQEKEANGLDYLTYNIFSINKITGEIVTNNDKNVEESSKFFIKLISFIDFAPLELVELYPNRSKGTRREGKVKNEYIQNVTVVDYRWNKKYYSSEASHVDPFFRWQPYGSGNSLRRWQLIAAETEGFERVYNKERKL